jgi:hypothetical protein
MLGETNQTKCTNNKKYGDKKNKLKLISDEVESIHK